MKMQVFTVTAFVQEGFSAGKAVQEFLLDQDWVSYCDVPDDVEYDIGLATCADDLATAKALED